MMNMNTIIKWTATAIVLSGATLTSLNIYPYNIYVLNVGTSLFLLWSIRVREPAMIAVNGGLLLIYLIGLLV